MTPLQLRRARVQIPADGRRRYVHDRAVQEVYALGRQDQREDRPPPWVVRAGRLAGAVSVVVIGKCLPGPWNV